MAETVPADPLAGAWDGPVGTRLAGLAAARIAAQGLAVVWFVVAARGLNAADFGVLSGGLALMVVLGGFADLGVTRTVVRHVAEDPGRLWPTYRRAVLLRIVAGAVVGVAAMLLLQVVRIELSEAAVAIAAWIAIVSGANEVGYAALRSVGRVRVEMLLLVLERSAFTIAGCAAIALGAGPLVPLAMYGATNTMTAVLATVAIHRDAHARLRHQSPPLLDREGRHTAAAASLVIVAPRVSIVVLLLRSTPVAVGSLAVAQKPTLDALALLAVAMLTPMLPMLRSRVVSGRHREAAESGFRLTSTVLVVCAPVLGWLIADSSGAIRLLYGNEVRPGARVALVVLCVATVFTIIRSFGELLCLAEERAGAYMRALAAGTATTLVVALLLVGEHGAAGAAWGSLAGETVALVLVLRSAPSVGAGAFISGLVLPCLLAAGSAAVALVVRNVGEAAALASTIALSLVALVPARRALLALDALAAPGHDADVGAEPGGYDVG